MNTSVLNCYNNLFAGNSHYQMMAIPPNMTVNTVPADLVSSTTL